MQRTNTCGELNKNHVDHNVELAGWMDSKRDHGELIFVDLRDRYGITQVVYDPKHNENVHKIAEKLRREDVIKIKGKVRPRGEGLTNPKLKTGEIEVLVDSIDLLSKAETPPIEIDDRVEAGEDLRLKYRYLDLRRPVMQKNIFIRHKAMQVARSVLNQNGFLEIETPMLMKATPEGARDYVVPSRVNHGKFYALPQSPQLYKQILMVSGFDRYYQIAKCLRDEDLRSDRQPEFTQIDVELSFPTQKTIFSIGEELIQNIVKETTGKKVDAPFKKLTYKESMDKYACDKPDLRFELFVHEVTDIVSKSDFKVFSEISTKGGIVKCINPKKDMGRKEIDNYIKYCQEELSASGMAWMRVSDKGLESNIAKYFPENVQKELIEKVGCTPGTVLMFIADKEKKCNDIISKFRNKLGKDLKLYDEKELNFCWVTDFPLFDYDTDTESWMPAHHMFTKPKNETIDFIESDPKKVVAECYDLVLNGVELASGSIREHRSEVQERIMKKVGFSKEEANSKFGFLLESFKYGAPPHGGFAIGFDRLVAMILGYSDIREVIAFPKNKSAECPMDNSPSIVDSGQLKELGIKIDAIKKK
jgi:aspartyl-tRNA synthetase